MTQTFRQRQILKFVERFHERHKTGVGIREIKTGCDISSTSETRRFVLELETAGDVIRTDKRANSIVPASTGAVPVPNGEHGG